jgi:hypothetical protein
MAEHTSAHWPTELYLPSPVVQRDNREAWMRAGSPDTVARSTAEVERRLASYRQIETDLLIDAEMQRIIRSGLESQTELPLVPPAPPPTVDAVTGAGPGEGPGRGRRVNARRQRAAG